MIYSTIQHSPQSHTLSVYTVQCTFSLGRGKVREKEEGQQYTSIVPSVELEMVAGTSELLLVIKSI